ncbi:DUF5681 domain-containing protein [Sphingomonas sp. CFBP 13720]|uniref:DUF5681 domain-containing protein n=1 Tax=Sphingomonas sp. CFBP 13720 TaxID=2775302 RepID=UPI0017838658|nr:DUF5681 domain-containing protein [Sphingomonas sp. CFBP 13720]MBD8678318.1 hypothetical protein [Sphingomonas sp. CFBP 13720]
MQYDDNEFANYFIDDDVNNGPSERPHGVRFGEGQPINRRGRPRGSTNIRTMTKRVARERHSVMIDGKRRRKTTLELILLSLKKKAAEGNAKAFRLQESWLRKLAPQHEDTLAVLIVPEPVTAEEWEAIYSPSMSDQDVKERFPYLIRARRAHQLYISTTKRSL